MAARIKAGNQQTVHNSATQVRSFLILPLICDRISDSTLISNIIYAFLDTYSALTSLAQCYNTENAAGTVEYCCGTDSSAATCCTNGSAFSVPVGQIILRTSISGTLIATTVTGLTSVPASPMTSTASLTTTSLNYSSLKSSYPSSTSNASTVTPTSSIEKSNAITLGLSVGLGLPLALAFLGLFLFLIIELRRHNNFHKTSSQDGTAATRGQADARMETQAIGEAGGRAGPPYEMPQGSK